MLLFGLPVIIRIVTLLNFAHIYAPFQNTPFSPFTFPRSNPFTSLLSLASLCHGAFCSLCFAHPSLHKLATVL